MKKYLLTLPVIMIILISCSENSTENNNSHTNFFPEGIGTEWFYEEYLYDSDQNPRPDSVYEVKAVLEGRQTILDKEAGRIVFYSRLKESDDDYEEDSEMFIHEDGSKVYVWSQALSQLAGNELLASFLDLEEKWLLLADSDDDFWRIHEQEIPKIEMMGLAFEGEILITGERGDKRSLIVKGKEIDATEFITKVRLEGKLYYNDFPINVESDVIIRFWLASGIGLVKQINENFIISSSVMELPITGSERVLKDYNIK